MSIENTTTKKTAIDVNDSLVINGEQTAVSTKKPNIFKKTYSILKEKFQWTGNTPSSQEDRGVDDGIPISSRNVYYENYYSGSDVLIFVGGKDNHNKWFDDITSLQYNLVDNKSPIYGYMSKHFDAVAAGTIIVQGQFAVAYSKRDYIHQMLGITDTSKSELDHAVETSEHGSYINKKGFDFIVSFGDNPKIKGVNNFQIKNYTGEVIENCHITSRSVSVDTTGEPILTVYSFFASKISPLEENETFDYPIPQQSFSKINSLNDKAIGIETPTTSIADISNYNKQINEAKDFGIV